MDLDDLTGATDAADIAERAQQGGHGWQNAAAEPVGEAVAQVVWQIVTLPWAGVRCVGHCTAGILEVAGEVIAAIVEAIAGGI